MVRHGNRILSQIARRLIEKNNIELENYDDNDKKYRSSANAEVKMDSSQICI